MNKNRLTVALCALAMTALTASAQKTKKADLFPLGNYEELTDTKPHDSDAAWAKLVQPTQLSWASIDTRYRRLDIPKLKQQNMVSLKAWRGERVNAQALLWTNVDLDDVQITVSDLRSGNSVIPASALQSIIHCPCAATLRSLYGLMYGCRRTQSPVITQHRLP